MVILVLQGAGKGSEAIAILEGQVDGGVRQEVSSTGRVVGGDCNVDGGTPVGVLLVNKCKEPIKHTIRCTTVKLSNAVSRFDVPFG